MNGNSETLTGGGNGNALREAEAAVLGACIIDPDALLKVRAVLGTEPDVFFLGNNRILWRAFNEVWDSGQPLDYTSVNWWLEDKRFDGDIPPAAITELINGTPTSIHAVHYAKRVYDFYRRRTMTAMVGQAVEKLYQPDSDLDDVQGWLVSEIFRNGAVEEESENVNQLAAAIGDHLKLVKDAVDNGGQVGIPFKLKLVDRILGGLRGGDLFLLAARPAMGKTTAALQLALNTALDGGRVLFYSLEMSKEQLISKFISHMSGIGYDELRQGTWKKEDAVFIDAAVKTLEGLDIVIRDNLFLVDEIRDHALSYEVQHGQPDLMVVDYIQLSGIRDGDRMSDNSRVGAISRALKLLARALDCPMIALSQLSRAVENRSDKRPLLSDLRDSGSLEQDADEVCFLYRDGYYDETSETPNVLEWIVRKNRHGTTGTASTFFDMPRGKITELEVVRTSLEY